MWLAPGAQCGSMCGFPPVTRGGTTTSPEPQCRSARRGAQRSRFSVSVTASTFTTGVESRPWSALVCFAGIGPGEVLDGDGRKWVGISQRRTRDWIRLQTMAHRRWSPADAVDGSSAMRDQMPSSPTLSGRSTGRRACCVDSALG